MIVIENTVTCKCGSVIGYQNSERKYMYYTSEHYIHCPVCNGVIILDPANGKSTEKTFNRDVDCPKCDMRFELFKEDVTTGALGYAYMKCPACEEKIYTDDLGMDDSWNKTITSENIEFPKDFSDCENAVKVSDEETTKRIKACIQRLEENEDEWGVQTSSITADTFVYVYKFKDEYMIYVGKNGYNLSIDR